MTIIPLPLTQKGRFLAYLRVSTPKQGEGSSLLTQREAIARFANERHLEIVGWHEEKVSAARRGRPIFGEVLRLLSSGKADGLIVHKIDRSARNLKDWADLGELIDRGVPVYFAGDGVDMSSRSGRLAADIQAVVAADYIRNLSEEAKRGIRKRLVNEAFPGYARARLVGSSVRGMASCLSVAPTKLASTRWEWRRVGTDLRVAGAFMNYRSIGSRSARPSLIEIY
jgi:hypothetical protein